MGKIVPFNPNTDQKKANRYIGTITFELSTNDNGTPKVTTYSTLNLENMDTEMRKSFVNVMKMFIPFTVDEIFSSDKMEK